MRHAHSYEQETQALVRALEAFQHYLFGVKFRVATDCRALSHWNTTKTISPKVERWLSFIQSFDIDFEHRPGTKLRTSDALSRDERFDLDKFQNGRYKFKLAQLNATIRNVKANTTDTIGQLIKNCNCTNST